MRKFTKGLGFFLALVTFFSSAMPAFASGLEMDENPVVEGLEIENDADAGDSETLETLEEGGLTERQELEISGVREDLLRAQKAVEDVEAPDEKYQEVLDKYNDAVVKLNGEIDEYEVQMRQAAGIGKQGNGSIYDLTSIPVRVQLLIRIGRAIRFGTTELSNKVVAAHTRLTEYIIVGILHTVNPFASEHQILEYIDQFEALQQELLAYPDLSPEDIATIYKKAAYHRTIREARKVRNDANRTGRKFQARELNKEISKSASLWWRIVVTCGELDEQEAKLVEAIERVAGPKIRVKSIEFMEGNQGAINLDKKTKLNPVILPVEAKIKDYYIISSNPYVVRVLGNEIVPLKPGSAFIECVSKDTAVKARFELTILNPGEYSSLPMLEATGDNNEFLYSDGNDHNPIGPPIYNETTHVKDISFTSESKALLIGEEYDLSERVLVFPDRAVDKTLSYESTNPEVAEVTEDGLITAIAEGEAEIRVTTVNEISKTFKVKVENPEEIISYSIDEVEASDRKAGVFTIKVRASENGEPYSGPAHIRLTAEDRTLERTFYMTRGEGEITFTGFDFGVWRKDFTGQVQVKDQVHEIEMTYR